MSSAIPTPNPTSAAWSTYLDNQNFNVTGLGGTPVTLNLGQIRTYIYYEVSSAIVYGFSVGFCAMVIIVLLLLTDSKKLRRPIYILNMVSLVLSTFRSIIACIIICSKPSDGIAPNFLGALAEYPTAEWAPLIMGYVLQPFIYASIVLSLILQVWVVFAVEPKTQIFVTGVLVLSGLALVVLEFYFAVVQIIDEVTKIPSINPTLYLIIRIYFVTWVGVSCLIFLYKLAVTIYRRRKMGIKKFGPLQIIFIMFSQCLVVPLVIYIVDLSTGTVFNLVGIGQTFIICSLPLSALWASSDAEGRGRCIEAPSFAESNTAASGAGKFSLFSRGKKSSQDSYSSYSDIEKSPDYSHDGIDVHTVQTRDKTHAIHENLEC